MPAPFDCLLVRPSAAEVVAALLRATEVIGRRGPLAGLDEGYWRSLLTRIESEREGRLAWGTLLVRESRKRGVVLAWWTDHQGGRHVRVWGVYTERPPPDRPPLWHIYPERGVRRQRGEREDWLAWCSCGEVGIPVDLAWMGPCCGPCHDRREESTDPLPEALPTFHFPGRVRALAFRPDGADLAVAARRNIYCCSVQGGETRQLGEGLESPVEALAFSPDGRTVAAIPSGRGVALLDSSGDRVERPKSADLFAAPSAVAFSPDGLSLAVWHENSGVEVWRRQPGRGRRSLRVLPGTTAPAWSPDGRTLAVGGRAGRVLLLDGEFADEKRRFETGTFAEGSVLFAAFTPDGRTLVLITGDERGQHLRVWDTERRYERCFDHLPTFWQAALSPDGSYLALACPSGELAFWDLTNGRQACVLQGNPGSTLGSLAFAPDGKTLAIAEGTTVKLWPWRALIEA
jgi:hypothetical protein